MSDGDYVFSERDPDGPCQGQCGDPYAHLTDLMRALSHLRDRAQPHPWDGEGDD